MQFIFKDYPIFVVAVVVCLFVFFSFHFFLLFWLVGWLVGWLIGWLVLFYFVLLFWCGLVRFGVVWFGLHSPLFKVSKSTLWCPKTVTKGSCTYPSLNDE